MDDSGDEGSEQESFGELWKAVFETFYDAYYNEMLAGTLVNRWQLVDETSKILVAVTASGSAISGWALWSQSEYRVVWAAVAAISAILGIVHSSMGVAQRLKDWGDIKRSFATLRIDLETLQYRMKFDFKATIREFKRDFIKYRRQYSSAFQRLRADLLLTNALEDRVQKDLDARLERDGKGISHGN